MQSSDADWLDLRMSDRDPHDRLAAARRSATVAKSAPIGLDPQPRYNVTRWDDVEAVLRDPEAFSSAICGVSLEQFMGETMLSKDGAEHRSLRGIVAKAFRPDSLERWETELIRPIIAGLVDRVAPNGGAELKAEVLSQFPIQVICGMYGVPLEDARTFHSWADDIIHGIHDPEPAFAAGRALREYLRPIVEDRRANPRDDLLSDLLLAGEDGKVLTEDQFYGTLILILSGGTDTTEHAFGSMLVGLLRQPDLLAAVTADRSLVAKAVEEALRWEGPANRAERVTTRDVTIRGCPIPPGSSINVWLVSANRDEERYPGGDEFRLDRERHHHLSFGTGPHQCLGIHLARRELQIGLETVLDRLPNLRLDPSYPPPAIEGTLLRGPKDLHVLWDTPSA